MLGQEDSRISQELQQAGHVIKLDLHLLLVQLFLGPRTVVDVPRESGELHDEDHVRRGDLDNVERCISYHSPNMAVRKKGGGRRGTVFPDEHTDP